MFTSVSGDYSIPGIVHSLPFIRWLLSLQFRGIQIINFLFALFMNFARHLCKIKNNLKHTERATMPVRTVPEMSPIWLLCSVLIAANLALRTTARYDQINLSRFCVLVFCIFPLSLIYSVTALCVFSVCVSFSLPSESLILFTFNIVLI